MQGAWARGGQNVSAWLPKPMQESRQEPGDRRPTPETPPFARGSRTQCLNPLLRPAGAGAMHLTALCGGRGACARMRLRRRNGMLAAEATRLAWWAAAELRPNTHEKVDGFVCAAAVPKQAVWFAASAAAAGIWIHSFISGHVPGARTPVDPHNHPQDDILPTTIARAISRRGVNTAVIHGYEIRAAAAPQMCARCNASGRVLRLHPQGWRRGAAAAQACGARRLESSASRSPSPLADPTPRMRIAPAAADDRGARAALRPQPDDRASPRLGRQIPPSCDLALERRP
jgi:hypothetical protein